MSKRALRLAALICLAAAILLTACARTGDTASVSQAQSGVSSIALPSGSPRQIYDLEFYLPDGFKEPQGEVEDTGPWVFFTGEMSEEQSEPSGAVVRVESLATIEGFELENWVLEFSTASVWRAELYDAEINGANWITGNRDNTDFCYYTVHNGRVYEVVIIRKEGSEADVADAVRLFEHTARFN